MSDTSEPDMGLLDYARTLLMRSGPAAPRPAPSLPVTEATPPTGLEIDARQRHFRQSIDMIEHDVSAALDRLTRLIGTSGEITGQTASDLDQIHAGMAALREAAALAARDVAELADSSGKVSASVETVSSNVAQARQSVAEAAKVASSATDIMSSLSTASAEISTMVDTIALIARQTNLLALNATIEAARAGDSGRGFAVVAQEVKSLSVETAKRVADIRKRVHVLEQATTKSFDAIAAIAGLITDVNPMVSAIDDAMHEQAMSVVELTRRTQQTARFVETVAERVGQVGATATTATERSASAASAAEKAIREASNVSRFVAAIRQAGFVARRKHDRFPCELPLMIKSGVKSWRAATIDISLGGALLGRPPDFDALRGEKLELVMDGVGTLPATLLVISPSGLHCAFDDMERMLAGRLRERIASVQAEYQPMIERTRKLAARIALAMQALVKEGALSEEALFATDYTPIAGADPPQFETPSLPALCAVMPPICEPMLLEDANVVYCVAMDRNGYIPVHNRIYAQPQRPGEREWNVANARDRRFYNDEAGLTAARSVRPFVIQSYRREMGQGQGGHVREIAVPIFVNDRHWGGLKVGFRLTPSPVTAE